jgi:uncharacterized protein
MSWSIARQAIDLLFKESLDSPEVHIRFFGGEPLLNWPVIQMCVEYAENKARITGKKASFSTVTNGILLNETKIRFMKDHHFFVQISIDGTQDMHDAFRVDIDQKGTYKQATRHVSDLIQIMPPTKLQARGTITHADPDIIKAFDHLRYLGFDAPEVRPVTGHQPSYGMTVEDYQKYNQGASELARRLFNSHPEEARHYMALFDPYLSMLISGSPRRPPCGAGRNMIGVATDGAIYPCTDMTGKEDDPIHFGDIHTGLRREKKGEFLQIVDVDNKIGCRNCWARYICAGACASVELSNQGGLQFNAGLECIWIRHVIELSLWLYTRMLRDRPDMFYALYGQETKIDLAPLMQIFATS